MTDAHVEKRIVPGRRLGRRAPDPSKRALKLGNYLTGVVPAHPVAVDHLASATYGLYENDRFGDCGPTSVANQRRLVTAALTGTQQSPSQDDVFDLYRRSGNPNFDPATDADDNGVDMKTMLHAVTTGGIGGVKALGWAAVDVSNLDEVRAAVAIFGSLLLGVNLETAQQGQTDSGVWDYSPSGEWGGHAILAGKYTSVTSGADVSVITWAEEVGVTDRFWTHQVQEAYVVIWPEHLGSVEFQQGVNAALLAADYEALTGEQFPVTPAPSPNPKPGPTPTPVPAPSSDRAFAAAARAWLNAGHQHGRVAHQLVGDLKAWLAATGN